MFFSRRVGPSLGAGDAGMDEDMNGQNPPIQAVAWLENVRRSLHIVTFAVRLRPHAYSSEQLALMAVMVGALSTDHFNTMDILTPDIQACLAALFSAIPEDEWEDWVSNIALLFWGPITGLSALTWLYFWLPCGVVWLTCLMC